MDWGIVGNKLVGKNMGDRFSRPSLSSDGSILACGAYRNNNRTGAVYVYKWNGSSWNQLGNTLLGERAYINFGHRVCLSSDGTILAISAFGTNNDTGSVYVYKWDGSNWIQFGNTLTGKNIKDYFGSDCFLSSDGLSLAIGANAANNKTGYVNVYKWNGTNWNQLGNTLNGKDINNYYGWSVCLSSNGLILAIGEDGANNNNGCTYVYKWNGSSWNQLGNTLNEINTENFGWSVSLSSDGLTLAVGAPQANSNGAGSTYVYKWDGSSWNQVSNTLFGQNKGDVFGKFIELSSDASTLAVSASNAFNKRGSVYLYKLIDSSLIQQGKNIIGESENDEIGEETISISSDGTIFAVGGHGNTGYIKVYRYSSTWDICFKAGSVLKTDQGFINIEELNINEHTINNEEILALPITYAAELNYLVCIEKDAFEPNVPNKDTYLTHTHKIEYKGQLVEAMTFLLGDFNNKIYKVEYNNKEPLYNVLLKDYTTMNVNNLVAETLHPNNKISKIYLNKYNNEIKN